MHQFKINASFPFAPKKWPFFYGYFIGGCSALGILMSAPGQTIGVSVFTDSLIDVLKLSRFQLSLAYMFGTVLSAMFIRRAGRLLDVAGVRIVAGASALGLGLVLLYMSRIDVITGWFDHQFIITMTLVTLGFLFMRFTGQGVLTLASRTMLMRWFVDKRGRMNAIVGVFTSLMFSASPLIFEMLINNFSWRGAWIVLAVIIGAGYTVFILFFYRDTPEDCDLLPDGCTHSHEQKNASEEENWTLSEVKKSWTFWVFNIGLSMFSLFITAITFHIVSIFEVAGLTRADAISIFLPASIISVTLNIISGWLADTPTFKYRLHFFLFLAVVGMIISSSGLLLLASGYGKYLIILGNGISGGVFGLLSSVAWPRYFGREHLGEIGGYAMAFLVFFSAIGPSMFGWSFDLFGNYSSAIFVCITILVVLGGLAFTAKRPVKKI